MSVTWQFPCNSSHTRTQSGCGTQHQNAFEALKKHLINPPVPSYHKVKKPVTLTCDASQYGLGVACLQEGLPVAYASRTLTDTETRYTQIEKELLAVVFVLKAPRLHLHQACIRRNRPPAAGHHNKKSHSCRTSQATKDVVETSKVGFTNVQTIN